MVEPRVQLLLHDQRIKAAHPMLWSIQAWAGVGECLDQVVVLVVHSFLELRERGEPVCHTLVTTLQCVINIY